ncbi:MAG: hypothetical protein NTY39_01255 [Campylobacterales bacterium]|nr:hypothetical protein [Campylobacterales bacterium]
MAEIKIERISDREIKIDIPKDLENSKIGEKFVTEYFNAQQKIIVEQAKAMQLRHQNNCDLEKQKIRYRYWFFGIFLSVIFLIIKVKIG